MNGMGDIEIRRLREEDFPAAVKAEGFAFGISRRKRRSRSFGPPSTWAAPSPRNPPYCATMF